MKKTILFCCCLVLSVHLMAQVQLAGSSHVKLSDVIANYQKLNPDYSQPGTNSILKKILPGLPTEQNEKYYQFDKWLWYWKQHTDGNGYLVSPAQTWQEWQKSKAQEKTASPGRGTERTTTSGSPAWVFMGPDSSEATFIGYGMGVGRANTIAFHPTDSNTYWIGTPGGGAWKTTNDGLNWVSMTDSLPLLSVSQIVFNPLNPNTVYLCTGDRDADDYYGIGVLKSYDGGITWNTTGMTWTADEYNVATSMVINPLDTNSLVLATTAGMYRSYDGGNTFDLVKTWDFYQVLYCPSDTNLVYATTFNYNGPGSAQIWRATDGGTTWTQQTDYTTPNRITIAVTPVAPNIVFGVGSIAGFSSSANGLDGIYKSSDSGSTFATIDSEGSGCTNNLLTWDAGGDGCGGQGWYTLPLTISPIDSNIVYTGGVNTWRSTDGGHTWTIANQWQEQLTGVAVVHADKHWMEFNPIAPDRFYETNDGGIFSSTNPVSSGVWNDLNHRIGIEEIYRTGVSDVASFAISGAQDVGTKITKPGGRYEEGCLGDGMACQLDNVDSTVGYGSSEYGSIYLINPSSAFPAFPNTDIASNILGGSIEGTGGWVTPFVLEPKCHSCILAGFDAIYRSKDEGTTWTTYSPSLTTNTIYRIATTMADTNTVFATDDSYSQQIYYTHNGGSTWTTLTAPYSGMNMIGDIKVDPNYKGHIWVGFANYGSPGVAEWTDTTGWQTMGTGLPNVPIMCLAVDYLSGDLYAGTEIGVYYRDTTMTNWAPFKSGMPSDEVTDLEINYATNIIWASTYGRSLWESPKHTATVLPTAVMNIVPFAPEAMTISPNPNHGDFMVTATNIADKQVTMHLTDAAGKTVWKGSGMLTGGKLSVHIQGLTAGTYIFEMDANNVVEGRQKMVVY